ncbi:Nramp family divalent metal transporter [Pseudonocardia sp. HH130630-07]|uniref:Nramp family divalent metal transporter n=1 Tax=Pseudonocardia sp. HH130630-07 TaxID=1690815 RepID=UPI0008152D6E|nr:Nramp family divalent metal transporter [Pseudonocardia sp. HH130630-07]ANY07635.1 iron transporter [Pseudonocardia sp. HH130630-07]
MASPGPQTDFLEPPTGAAKIRSIGPGLLAAATGVGAGDLVATMVAGASYGTALLWAALVGTLVKLALGEAVGRWHLASGATMLDGWRRLGYWATGFFGVYIVVWGFVYGATAMSAVGLPLNALFGGLQVRYWAMLAGLAGVVLVWLQRYHVFEKFMTVLVVVKFFSVVFVAFLVGPDLGALVAGLRPTLPPGSTVYVLGLIGGVGGTITMAAYGYWLFAKGWKGPKWLSMMRLDNATGYIMTGIFVVSMLVVGSTVLLGQNLTESDSGLLTLADRLGELYGPAVRIVFLIGFLSVTFTSLLGVWNGVSLLFTDWVRAIRLPHGRRTAIGPGEGDAVVTGEEHTAATAERADGPGRAGVYEAARAEKSLPFRFYLLWLTFPPMVLLLFDRPFALTLVYGVLGSFFMPFLAITLMLLLNTNLVAREGRNGWLSNGILGISSVLFAVLLVTDVYSRLP